METITKTEVLIVGAGPTGLSLAAQLMRYGIDFVIFDKKEGVTDLSKALVVHARTLEIYDQLDLARKAILSGSIVQKGALMHDAKISAHLDFSDFGGRLSPFPFLLVFEQSKNEHLLYEHLQQNGKDVQWQTEMNSFTQDANGVKAVLKAANGDTQTIEAQYLVGCDGASSLTRHLLNVEFEGSTYPRLFYVADVDMEWKTDEHMFSAALGQDAFVLIVPMQGEKHWRLIGNMPEHDYNNQVSSEVSYDEVENKVKQLVRRPLDITNVRWFSTYKVHTRHAEKFKYGRCFLAGDAAHVHTPAGGQGMNTGIQDVYNLAWKIAFILKGYAKDSLLESYNEERLANAKHLLHTTDQFFNVAAGEQWYFRFIRNNILPSVASFVSQFGAAKEFIFPMVSQIGLNYHDSSLSRHEGDHDFEVKAGDRMPYFLVNGANVYDQLRAPKFHLLIFSDGQQDYQGLKLELEKEYGDLIDFNVIPLYPRVIEIFGKNQTFKVLLRPDNYIGFISKEISLKDLKAYFRAVA
ncbi:oxygenase [Dulcicalothrix desertica PCC 7102]|uniref:Oxygenase n=1 Tax=Dulcicalothrix desertica PCC 7102 TaxID=232991 RepID=A0A3S1B186_9CYAN|nr:FAD-dependent monooxygenase [Dulcicalothrix desertica]RUT02828.1 oxygenase [Dulcicalothrix desertica PCC 7102]TWH38939.1 2-polyprenyl-6-methoxyphenol hydroxylase-like FAD-dependent oxidoreductase [Dulcicalothrix desertica PCC 7102]